MRYADLVRDMGPHLVARFWGHTERVGECWQWTAGAGHRGYGMVYIGGRRAPGISRTRAAHRVAYVLATGRDIPCGMLVCHRCDNPPCVNPDHLFLGTYADNYHDAKRKGRHTAGERHGRLKITDEQVREIRAAVDAGTVKARLAERYGVSQTTIGRVARGVARRG